MPIRFLLLWFTAVALLIALGCGYAKHIDPPLYTYDSYALTYESARLHARDVGGYVTLPVLNTHSMEPLIWGGDLLVIVPPKVSLYGPALKGRVIGYHPEWQPELFVVHRVVAADKDGLLVEGDNVDARHHENKTRVTEANYLGEVVAIYRTRS